MTPPSPPNSADWLSPPPEQEGLQRYVETIRERFWLILLTIAVTTGLAVAYVLTATKEYDAQAQMLVTPVPSDNPVQSSLGLIPASVDPTRDIETAASLVKNVNVAERVAEGLDLAEDPQDLEERVSAEPVAQSNLVAITIRDPSPEEAQELANAFATETIELRTEQMHAQIDERLPFLQAQAEDVPDPDFGEASILDRIAELQLLRSGSVPDMRVQTLAPLPDTQSTPRPALSIAAGLLAGLILGLGGAFSSQVLDPRLRREAQLRRLYRLPILARIPREAQKRGQSAPLSPRQVSPVIGEAYRTLRATLQAQSRGQTGRVILVTGSSPSEGKTTTAVNLATSLALAGKRVILIESDLRRPVLGEVMGASPEKGGVVSVLIENTTLEEALTPTENYGPNLQLLLADYEGGWIAELFSIPTAEKMIDDARRLADFVIIDSPPLNEVVDALPLARRADDVLIVVRLGTTRLDKLQQLGELLAENEVRPVGFAVVGTPRPSRGEYHYYAGVAGEEGADKRPERQMIRTDGTGS